MKHARFILTLLFMTGLGLLTSKAQQGVVSAGGEATGSGGSMSFSTGQTDFMYFSSENGSIQFGLQQVFFFDDDEIPIDRFLTSEDILSGEDQCFDAYETIILAGGGNTFIVGSGTGVDLLAGHSIRMLPGTMVEHGGHMHARITSADGPFCNDAEKMLAATPRLEPLSDEPSHATPSDVEKDVPGIGKSEFFKVYPNPTAGDFTVEILDTDLLGASITIEIMSMRGEVAKRIDAVSHLKHHLSLQDKQPGLYLIRVQGGPNVGTQRIIKR